LLAKINEFAQIQQRVLINVVYNLQASWCESVQIQIFTDFC